MRSLEIFVVTEGTYSALYCRLTRYQQRRVSIYNHPTKQNFNAPLPTKKKENLIMLHARSVNGLVKTCGHVS